MIMPDAMRFRSRFSTFFRIGRRPIASGRLAKYKCLLKPSQQSLVAKVLSGARARARAPFALVPRRCDRHVLVRGSAS